MRLAPLLRFALLSPLALATTACVSVPEPCPDAWLAVGFRTPEQTFATFQTGFAGDRPGLEYRCLSAGFKRAISEDFTELAYREYREELLREEPHVKYLSRAEIVDRVELAPDRVRLTARVEVLWIEREFEVELVQEHSVRLQHGADVVVAERLGSLDEVVEIYEDDPDQGTFARVYLPPVAGIRPTEFSEILVATDWKIDALRTLPDP